MRPFHILPVFAVVLLALPALALNLPPMPEGTCAVDTRQAPDYAAVQTMHLTTQTESSMKALFAECAELENLRLGRVPFLSRYGDLVVRKEPLPAGTTRAGVVDAVASASGMAGAVSSQMLQPINADPGQRRRTGPPSFHSVLKRSAELVILGSEQRHQASDRNQYAVAAVSAVTVVGNELVVMNFYAPLTGETTFPLLSKKAESYAVSLLAANP